MPADSEMVTGGPRPPSTADRDEMYRIAETFCPETDAPPVSMATVHALTAVVAELGVPHDETTSGSDAAQNRPDGVEGILRRTVEMGRERQRGRFSRARELADELRILDSGPMTPGATGVLAEQRALSYLMDGDSVRALATLAAAPAASVQVDPLIRRSLLLSSIVHALRGNLREARQFLHRAERIETVPGPHRPGLLWETLACALVRIESMAQGDGMRTAPLPAVEASGELWPLVMLAQGREALGAHSPLRAIESAEFALQCHETQGPLALSIASWVLVHGHLGLGDLDRAEAALADHAPVEGVLSRLAEARLFLERDQPMSARGIADQLISLRAMSVAVRGEALLLRIWADCLIEGRPDPRSCAVAARLATHSGLLRPFTQMPRWLIDEIADAIEGGLAPRFHAATRDLAMVSTRLPTEPLSPREHAVLDALFDYSSVAELAAALHVSPSTVKSQLNSAYRKLGVHSRSEAIAAAVRAGLRPRDRSSGTI